MAEVTPPLLALQPVLHRYGKGRRCHFEMRLDVRFERPEVIGLFGPNGAGKSTLMGLISGKLDPTDGEVRVCGHGLGALRRQERERMVRYLQQPRLAKPQAGRFAALVLNPADWYRHGREAFLDLWRSKAPAGGPHIYLFDEPSLEPPYAGFLFDRFVQLRDQGRWVMFTAHPNKPWHMKLIRGVCDRYAFMQDGELRFFDDFASFSADAEVADYLGALANDQTQAQAA